MHASQGTQTSVLFFFFSSCPCVFTLGHLAHLVYAVFCLISRSLIPLFLVCTSIYCVAPGISMAHRGQVWVPAGLRGACSGRRQNLASKSQGGLPLPLFFFYFFFFFLVFSPPLLCSAVPEIATAHRRPIRLGTTSALQDYCLFCDNHVWS